MTDGDYYGGSDWSYRRGTVGGMTSRGYGRYGGYGGYDDYCASPPVHKRAKRPFSHVFCLVRVQTAAAATARTAAATAADTAGATADTMTTVSINVHGPIPPPLWSLLVVAHPISLTPLRALLSLSLFGLVRADGGWGGGGYGSEYGSRDQARRTLANANWS